MTVAVVAEKPSVARDLASVLGATQRGEGRIDGGGYVVTWAIGHLVALAQPKQIRAEWGPWTLARLPMLPGEWPLEVVAETRAQFEIVRKILRARGVTRVICATDAGREGELIFRYIYEAAGCNKPVSRLWISSLTPDAIRDGFRRLRQGRELDGLADAARGRSRADWLVGMNLSRAYSLTMNDQLSVGRVQTPTLAMLAEREKTIRAFVPEDYLEVVATFTPEAAPRARETPYRGILVGEHDKRAQRLPSDGVEAARIVDRVSRGRAAIDSIERETRKLSAPQLYDLTELQRHANRLYGMTAQATLDVAQQLYEEKKLLSYPRTDSRHLSSDVEKTLAAIVGAVESRYPGLVAPGTGTRRLGARFVDDAKVTDHHAIVPTTIRASDDDLSAPQRRIYDLVCRRLLQAWHDDHIYATTRVVTAVATELGTDRFESTGTSIERIGWKALEISPRKKGEDAELPAGLAPGQRQAIASVRAVPKRTQPPQRLTEATLLTAMETAGKKLDDPELADAMRDVGLGTPATRAAIIETLLRRGYVERSGKSLVATDKGVALVDAVHADVKSPAMTAEWEAKLARIQRGAYALRDFIAGIERYVSEVVDRVRTSRVQPRVEPRGIAQAAASASPSPRAAGAELGALLRTTFGLRAFRPHQEDVCRAVAAGRDVLLVMPTGAGKSLCYQLPGLWRSRAAGGTTLVVSPLIALMEDQVQRLAALGLAVERIHSGRDRVASRHACEQYLTGRLDFLFIAPERLRVAGFPEMLARRPPSLIAIDEAHCISKWGHDFRPEYRMLGRRLPLRGLAPVIALTATATPRVQDDIVGQLGLVDVARFIHGFRRENLAIELCDSNPAERGKAVRALLRHRARRPAIVYAPTRALAEELAGELATEYPVAAYHAGMDSSARGRAQSAFLAGELDVVVATIAFGMGIDKADIRTVVHAGSPGSLEAYYQEIGRAGRDGAPARAILLHSSTDRGLHEYFFERDYPNVEALADVAGALGAEAVGIEELRERVGVDGELLDKALEKLSVHGGAVVLHGGPSRTVRRPEASTANDWRADYVAQRAHRRAEITSVSRFAQSHTCRMLTIVRHFGDREDRGEPCGLCDVCAPDACVAARVRKPSRKDLAAQSRILGALARVDGIATGRLHRETFAEGELDRRSFEHLLGALVRSKLVAVREESFEGGDETVSYARASLTAEGRRRASVEAAPKPKSGKKHAKKRRRRAS